MADNITITQGTGTTMAADDVSSVYYQRVKVSVGADGTAGDATPTNPLPVASAGSAFTSSFGVSSARVSSADATTAVSVTDAPTSGQKIVIDDVLLTNHSAVTLQLNLICETSGVVIASFSMLTETTFQWSPVGRVKLATADKKLQVQADAAGQIYVTATYHSEA